ncbi:hybrid sensor histidine kinase/response regulator [Candidatus Albibeggiatoa sp. nov. BB20]|uniref:hybrid sensor histidine kinase/response regulator n=1 Tax=Candidatus Albibeggiatoa sp. nov. BB20 TaxID=3162723 RepID=UPI0033658892
MDYIVLIVDDVPKNLQVVGNILKDQAIHSYAALSGKQAVKVLENTRIDLILLDISMPEMDGYEVCRQIKQNPKLEHIPIIFLTARSQTEDVVKGFECGGVDFITKPFNSAELLQRVKTHLKLKHYEDELAEKNNQLQELNATKDKFFSIIAHDLRNPFNTLLSISELLLDEQVNVDEMKRKEFQQMMYDNAKCTYALIENLLLWSRSQRNKIDFNQEVIYVRELLRECIMLVQHTIASAKQIELVLEKIDEDLQVVADYEMISTVVRNLLSNAVKFSYPKDKIHIGVQVSEQEKVLFHVKDTGIGMNPSQQQKLFKIENTYSRSGTQEEKGTGLGLILCKEFIEKNNGQIWVESIENQGTTFYFSLEIGFEEIDNLRPYKNT